MTKPSFLTFRLLAETLAIVASVVFAVDFMLPVIAPGVGRTAESVLDTTILTFLSGPLILWRMNAAVKRAGEGRTRGGGGADASPTKARRLTIAASAVVLVIGLGCSLFGAWRLHEGIAASDKARFEHLAERLKREVGRRFDDYAEGLCGLRAFYAGSKSVERGEFRAFVASHDLPHDFPGAVGFGFSQRVPRDGLNAFIAAERADGAPDFAVRALAGGAVGALGPSDLYIIKFIEPLEPNRTVVGLDIAPDPVRREAYERAMLTGEPTLSGKVTLVQDGRSHPAFLYLLPIYRNGTHPTTPQERRRDLAGWVYMPLVVEQTMAGVAAAADGRLDLEVYDGMETTTQTLLYDDDHVPHAVPNAPVEVGDGARMFRERTVITVGGREWTLWLGTMPVFDAEHDRASPVLAVCGGALISILLALVVWGMGTGRARALALAQTMTADLALAKDRAEGALRETEALRSTVDHHSIVSVADVKGRIIEVNDALCRISGYAREELLGQDHRIFNSGHHPKSFWVQMWRTIAGGQAWREEVCNRAKNGSLYWVDSIIAPFKGADGSIEKYISLRTDITERKRADQELVGARDAAQAANRAKSEFLANMSHEIRTPMTAILGYAALLMEDPVLADNPPKRRECLTTMKRNGEHLLAVINDILDLSRIEADKLSVEKISVAPAAIVEEVLSAIRVKASEKKLALDTVWETPVPAAIATDPVRLRQVLVNLLGNAVKFTESGGVRLGIACEPLAPGGGALRFTVTDTGIGMTPEQMGRVFNAFEQADTTMSRRFGGTGLGLRIARSLARMLGGDIAVASEPDAGSTFTLTIATGPLDGVAMIDAAVISQAPAPTPAAPQEPRLPHPAAPSLAGLRVLLAEDGPDNQRLIAFHLRKAGAQVAVADNGLLAVRALCAGGEETGELTAPTPFDLILMDMQMPAMDGYTAVAALRAKGCTLPIIALTAHAMTGDKEKCLAAGCDDYASKPIDKALLLAKVAKWNGVRGGSRAVRAAA